MESPDKIRKHIKVLSKFEKDYGKYIAALEADSRHGQSSGWSQAEFGKRKRVLQQDAVRADMAIKASGVGGLVFTEPPAIGGGVRSSDLPSQIFDFIDTGFHSDGLDFQRALLDRMPSQIAGLEVRLEEAEARPKFLREAHVPRLFSRVAKLPPWLGFIADLITVIGFIVAVVGVGGKLLGFW